MESISRCRRFFVSGTPVLFAQRYRELLIFLFSGFLRTKYDNSTVNRSGCNRFNGQSGMNSDHSDINSILIVGGGTAGWLCAAMLRAYLKSPELDITLVESADIPIIGVGEATVPPLVELVRRLGIDEDQLMRRCNATWKLGIRFDAWHSPQHSYWHPFGLNAGKIDGLPFYYFWLKHRLATGQTEFTDFSPNAELARSHRAPTQPDGRSPVIDQGFYAYHLDAALLAGFLKEICIEQGVHQIIDTVTVVQCDENGIHSVKCKETGELRADLYIDCSGFSALLSEGGLGIPWEDWSDMLLCNRAVAIPLQPTSDYPPFTRAHALEAGWVWRVPLYDRTGCGYVFSSDHIDDDTAIDNLRTHVGQDQIIGEPRVLSMRVGRRRRLWQNNCIAAGLAAGFVEPLESTGIYLIQAGMEQLLRYFPDRSMNPALVNRYNDRMATMFEEVRDFIVLHYHLAGRSDSDFWNDARNTALSPRLRDIIDFHDATGMVEKPVASLFPALSIQTIMAGNNRLPKHEPSQSRRIASEQLHKIFQEIARRNSALADSLPDHRVMLEHLHGRGLPGQTATHGS